MVLGHNGHAVRTDQLARGWFVGSGQVEEVVHCVASVTIPHHVIILRLANHLAAMGDGLNIILILVARLVQGILEERQEAWLINQQGNLSDSQNVTFKIAFTRKSGVFIISNAAFHSALPTHCIFVTSLAVGFIMMKFGFLLTAHLLCLSY